MRKTASDILSKAKEKRGYLLESHRFLAAHDPEFLEAYENLFEKVMTEDRALTVKTKELIVIALLASKGQYPAVQLHAKRAMEHQATAGEVLESLETAMLYSGAPSLIYGLDPLIKLLSEKSSPSPS
jgi:4-carboxymuconolactone decarboxylase